MRTLMIDYDLITPGQKYADVIAYIKGYNAWANAVKSTWLIRTAKTTSQVRDEILTIIDANDKVLVTDVTNAAAAWSGLAADVSNWLRNNVGLSPSYR